MTDIIIFYYFISFFIISFSFSFLLLFFIISHMTTSLHKLSLPSSITSTNESETAFSRDLLRQFDKKRSQLHFELGFASQVRRERGAWP